MVGVEADRRACMAHGCRKRLTQRGIGKLPSSINEWSRIRDAGDERFGGLILQG